MIFGLSSLKLAGAALGALFVLGALFAAYSYVDALSERLSASQTALAREQDARAASDARADDWKRQHDQTLARLEILSEANRRSNDKITALNRQISTLNIARTVDADPAGTADRLNSLNRDLNRLLERATGARDGDGGAAGAGSPAAAEPAQP